jgi:hypothetical protein
MQVTYRPPDLGSYVRPPTFGLWTPPPTLKASQDPYLLHRAIKGLRQLGGTHTAPPRPPVPSSRLYGGAATASRTNTSPRAAASPHGSPTHERVPRAFPTDPRRS